MSFITEAESMGSIRANLEMNLNNHNNIFLVIFNYIFYFFSCFYCSLIWLLAIITKLIY